MMLRLGMVFMCVRVRARVRVYVCACALYVRVHAWKLHVQLMMKEYYIYIVIFPVYSCTSMCTMPGSLMSFLGY